jgi:hypothetical protein
MRQTPAEITQNVAERLGRAGARRDGARIARRRYRKPLVDGVYRLDAGAVLGDFFHFLRSIGVMALLERVHGTAIRREVVPYVQDCLALGVEDVGRHPEQERAAPLVVQRCGGDAAGGLQCPAGPPGQLPAGGGETAGGADAGADQRGDVGQQSRPAARAGSGGRVQWGDSGLGRGRHFQPAGHRDSRGHGPGDHPARSRLRPGDPHGPAGRYARAEARDRGDGLWRESAAADRGRPHDPAGGQGGADPGACDPLAPGVGPPSPRQSGGCCPPAHGRL